MCMSSAAAAAPAAPAPAGYQVLPYLQYYEDQFSTNINAALVSADHFLLTVAESAVVFLIILGLLIYATRLNERLGKKLLEGGIIMGIFLALVVPYLATAYC
jgi:hypothetical protein